VELLILEKLVAHEELEFYKEAIQVGELVLYREHYNEVGYCRIMQALIHMAVRVWSSLL
jgi:hypothetical protein